MDFLENRFLAQNQNQRKSYVYRERRTYELLHELEDEEFCTINSRQLPKAKICQRYAKI